MKLYIKIDYKDRYKISGTIKNKTRKVEEGDIVFDPFCGSGSTLVSAKNNNRHYLGIDIEKKWVDVAKDRLNNTDQTGQYSMFTI